MRISDWSSDGALPIYNVLYRPAPPRWRRALEFLLADFPRLVRAQRGCLWASATLLVVSTVAMYLAVRWRPELVHSLFDPRRLAQFESMYEPSAAGATLGPDCGSDPDRNSTRRYSNHI